MHYGDCGGDWEIRIVDEDVNDSPGCEIESDEEDDDPGGSPDVGGSGLAGVVATTDARLLPPLVPSQPQKADKATALFGVGAAAHLTATDVIHDVGVNSDYYSRENRFEIENTNYQSRDFYLSQNPGLGCREFETKDTKFTSTYSLQLQ